MPSPRPSIRRGRYRAPARANGMQPWQSYPLYHQESVAHPAPDPSNPYWNDASPYALPMSSAAYGMSPQHAMMHLKQRWHVLMLWGKESLWKWTWRIALATLALSAVVGSSYRMGHWVDWVNPFHWISVLGAGGGNAVRGVNQQLDGVNTRLEQTGGLHIQPTYSTGTPLGVSVPSSEAPLPPPAAVDSSYRVDPAVE